MADRCEYPGLEARDIPSCLTPEESEMHFPEVTVPPTKPAGSNIPVTGGDAVGLVGIGVTAIIVGIVLVQRARRVT